MGFDAKKFADDYDHFDLTKDINAKARVLQAGDMREATCSEMRANLQNYYAIGLLSKVKYSINVEDATLLYGRKVFSEAKCKAIEKDVRSNVVSTLSTYDVTEVKSTTSSDVPLIDVEICIRNDSQVVNAIWIETKVMVRRTLLDPASKRPITATVWEDRFTRVYTKEHAHLLVTKEHPDLAAKIIHDAESRIFLLSCLQYRSFTTMKAAIQLEKEGILPDPFSEYLPD
jgi:hypothetical protein